MLSSAAASCVHVLVAGSYSSGMSPMQVMQVVEPDATSTRPSASVTAVGYQRWNAIGANDAHAFVTGSNRLTSGIPTPAEECPPAMRTLPSPMCTGPEQKMLSAAGT